MRATEINLIEKTIVSGLHSETLLRIAEPATALAIWRRQLTEEVKGVAKLISEHAFELVISLNPYCKEDSRRFTQELITSTGCDCTSLADDLIDLSRRYGKVSQMQTVRIRLETVKDDGCRRFHLDNVVMRLVVTYAGEGTQWVLPEFAVAARDRQMSYEGPLNRLGTGNVAIFRGKKSEAKDLIYHRSPPLKPTDPARLVAVIDGAYA